MNATGRFSLTGCRALITGASSGLGAGFARALAPRASALALAARREAELQELARELQGINPALQVLVCPCDLREPADREALARRLTEAGFQPTVLINNAGLGDYGTFGEGEWAKIDAVLRVNISALTHLTHLLLPVLRGPAPSGILNVSSLAGEVPLPDFAVYAASKAYVTRFSEALRIEEASHGIVVTALCPGPVHTGFGSVAERPGETVPKMEIARRTVEQVVEAGLRGLESGRPRVFPGAVVWLTARAINLLPLPLLRRILARRLRRPTPASPS